MPYISDMVNNLEMTDIIKLQFTHIDHEMCGEEVARRRKMAFSIRRCANLVAFHICTIFRVINFALEPSAVLYLNVSCFEISKSDRKNILHFLLPLYLSRLLPFPTFSIAQFSQELDKKVHNLSIYACCLKIFMFS